eukprot:jgi/Mesvir1/6832/Mv09013-RA.1
MFWHFVMLPDVLITRCTGSWVHNGAINPDCDFNGAELDATCETSLAVQATVDIFMDDVCILSPDPTPSELEAFRAALFDALARSLPGAPIPACALDFSWYKRPGTRRRLMQSVHEIVLAFKVYMNDIPQATALMDLVNSHAFGLFLASYFNVAVGDVQTVQNMRAVFWILSSATSDPHFTTSRGEKFDFNGEANRTYCIVTDRALQVNARLTGPAHVAALPVSSSLSGPDTRTWMDHAGYTADRAERAKLLAYGDVGQHRVVPFVLEEFGAMGPLTSAFFKECCRLREDRLDLEGQRAPWSARTWTSYCLLASALVGGADSGHG